MILTLALAICAPTGERVTCLHDGDSFIVDRERIRIENIDTPEINGQCTAERQRAIAARSALLAMLNSGEVAIYRTGRDRYGRSLARVSVNGRDVGEAMIAGGYARRWTGRREPWC